MAHHYKWARELQGTRLTSWIFSASSSNKNNVLRIFVSQHNVLQECLNTRRSWANQYKKKILN